MSKQIEENINQAEKVLDDLKQGHLPDGMTPEQLEQEAEAILRLPFSECLGVAYLEYLRMYEQLSMVACITEDSDTKPTYKGEVMSGDMLKGFTLGVQYALEKLGQPIANPNSEEIAELNEQSET